MFDIGYQHSEMIP